jgi:NAD(P)-dependent dehydrogenase (short-subunit alcohol dehydrogenase family)
MAEDVRKAIPLGRFATREEVAEACSWLASGAASYVTGECLTIDGGAWLGRGLTRNDGPVTSVRRRRERTPE